MKINKYLKELGLDWYDMPGVYDEKLNDIDSLCDKAAADPRNKEDEEGFCGYEFFSLDHTLSLFIYSKLCYFREHIADICTPGCLCTYTHASSPEEREYRSNASHNKWLSIVDKMILAFKLKITGVREGFEGVDNAAIREGMYLFAEYYDCLWY